MKYQTMASGIQRSTLLGNCPAVVAMLLALLLGAPAFLQGQVLQPRMGDPIDGLTADQLSRFFAGQIEFTRTFIPADGLGPGFNQDSCASCHAVPIGGAGTIAVTRFGAADKGEPFDPLAFLGGSLLQANAISDDCLETVPAAATITAERITPSILGAGLIEAIPEADLLAGISNGGVAHMVGLLEDPAAPLRVGRFGWKAQLATLLSFSGDATLNEMGITNSIVGTENAPNGDQALLAQCDTVLDPEEPLVDGVLFVDRITDFQRFLAPPPQTPRNGMAGEVIFNDIGCADCHTPQFTSGVAPEAALSNRVFRPYSDFLLHDMAGLGDGIAQGDALEQEIKTPPLWGIRVRGQLLHDGRVLVQTLAQGIDDAIGWHFGDASAASVAWSQLSAGDQALVVSFLNSLGRAEFDMNGDGFIGSGDVQGFADCWTGDAPGSFDADSPCAVADLDQDGDVDADDLNSFELAYLEVPEDCDNDGTWDLVQILTAGGDANGNGVLDACEGSSFRRGDGNGDGVLDIGDPVLTLSILFGGAGPATCEDAHDANDDGAYDISDPIYSLGYLFGNGPVMPAPGSTNCGTDPTVDTLDCDSYLACP
ncbi:MAG: di-heme oxidoredictase family protein [Planctomycetota bacterium]|nr:di-heme oxidoredictase family protein [Planctomycetota bacterium]